MRQISSSCLFRQVALILPGQPDLDGKVMDLRWSEGKIVDLAPALSPLPDEEVIAFLGLSASMSWVDMFASCGAPGNEHREDFESISRAALAGGFGAVALLPDTTPYCDHSTGVNFVKKNGRYGVSLLPYGAITLQGKGKALAELWDMNASGAVGFCDGLAAVQDASVMLLALQYAGSRSLPLISTPQHQGIAGEGMMHEGELSTALGLRGIPALAEELMIARDIRLAEYADANLHFANISTANGVEQIRQAKQKGLKITASVSAQHLYFDDSALADFNTALKIVPPIRGMAHRNALIDGLADGTIDAVHSTHRPLENDLKNCEFAYAAYGAGGIETAFAQAWTAVEGNVTIGRLVQTLAIRPREILHLPFTPLAHNGAAELTFFTLNEERTWQALHLHAKSANYPALGKNLRGRVKAVATQGALFLID